MRKQSATDDDRASERQSVEERIKEVLDEEVLKREAAKRNEKVKSDARGIIVHSCRPIQQLSRHFQVTREPLMG